MPYVGKSLETNPIHLTDNQRQLFRYILSVYKNLLSGGDAHIYMSILNMACGWYCDAVPTAMALAELVPKGSCVYSADRDFNVEISDRDSYRPIINYKERWLYFMQVGCDNREELLAEIRRIHPGFNEFFNMVCVRHPELVGEQCDQFGKMIVQVIPSLLKVGGMVAYSCFLPNEMEFVGQCHSYLRKNKEVIITPQFWPRAVVNGKELNHPTPVKEVAASNGTSYRLVNDGLREAYRFQFPSSLNRHPSLTLNQKLSLLVCTISILGLGTLCPSMPYSLKRRVFLIFWPVCVLAFLYYHRESAGTDVRHSIPGGGCYANR